MNGRQIGQYGKEGGGLKKEVPDVMLQNVTIYCTRMYVHVQKLRKFDWGISSIQVTYKLLCNA